MVHTDQVLEIKVATNIYPQEHKADVDGKKKVLVQLLKQFQTHYYQLYEKGMTHAMMGLQGLHLSDAPKYPHISAGMGLKSFSPWCLKLGANTETITIHLFKVHYGMAVVCDICQHDSIKHFETMSQSVKGNATKSTWSMMPVKCEERPRSLRNQSPAN